MRAVNFSWANSTLLAGDMPDCEDLPVHKTGEIIISKWKLSWRERTSALFYGTAWIFVRAKSTAPPIAAQIERG